jgi:hypothetical protein
MAGDGCRGKSPSSRCRNQGGRRKTQTRKQGCRHSQSCPLVGARAGAAPESGVECGLIRRSSGCATLSTATQFQRYAPQRTDASAGTDPLASVETPAEEVDGVKNLYACNECVLELYHLRSRLAKIQSVQVRKCPSLRALVQTSKLRAARKQLDEYFPDIEALRHATAHRGQNEAHPEQHAPDGQYALTGFREPDRYSAPYQGRLYTLNISEVSLQQISEVVSEYLGAFKTAAAELERQGHLE